MWPRTWCSLSRHSWSRTLSLRNFRPTAPAVTSFPSGKPWCLSIKSNISRRVFLGHCPNTLPVINYDIFLIHSRRCIEFITEEPESLFSWIKLPFFVSRAPGSLSQNSHSLSFQESTCSIFCCTNFIQFPSISPIVPLPLGRILGYILNFDLSLCADVIFNYHFAGWGSFWDHVHTCPYQFAR